MKKILSALILALGFAGSAMAEHAKMDQDYVDSFSQLISPQADC